MESFLPSRLEFTTKQNIHLEGIFCKFVNHLISYYMQKRIAIFPGSFDPITIGHEDILKRVLPLFDEVIIAIGKNSSKQSFFSLEQRKKWIETVFSKQPKVKVDTYTGLTVDYCKKMKANFIIRGLRTSADFEFEKAIAQNNKMIMPEVETIFILPIPALSAINSTIVRDIIRNGGDAARFVPKGVNLTITSHK